MACIKNSLLGERTKGCFPTKFDKYSESIQVKAEITTDITKDFIYRIPLGISVCSKRLDMLDTVTKETLLQSTYISITPTKEMLVEGFDFIETSIDVDKGLTGLSMLVRCNTTTTIEKFQVIGELKVLSHKTILLNVPVSV